MEAIKERPRAKRRKGLRVEIPAQQCLSSHRDLELEWSSLEPSLMPELMSLGRKQVAAALVSKIIAKPVLVKAPTSTPNKSKGAFRLSRRVLEEYMHHVKRVRLAQQKDRHSYAIRLTTEALQQIRQQSRVHRRALNKQTQELLNLRSLSLIALGECGEAWRCIALMSRLWAKG